MADPSSEEDGLLREWAPLTGFLQQIPLKAQRGLFTHNINLTCVDILPEFIAVGTSLGLVYWYNRKKGDLQRLRCENTGSPITCVKVISTVDFMVAAGNDQGLVTVFQIPKTPPDGLPESMKPKKNKQVERYSIGGLHLSPLTAIEWSMNGMKLFSGDKNGLVVLTEIDFYMHLSKSVELLNEKYEIVQLSYSQQLLLVSTLYRSIVCCHREDRWKVSQVGQKERKVLGRLGATFYLGSGHPQELVVYSSRPGLRVWLADKNGVVQQTLIYKDAVMREHTHTPLINPASSHVRQSRGDHQFGPLLLFREHLVTYSSDVVYVLNPITITVVATVADLRGVLDVAVNKDEIFILEGERSLIRVAFSPENIASDQGTKFDYRTENILPVSLSDITVASSIMDLTSKLKDSAIVSAIPMPKLSTRISIFGSPGSKYKGTNSESAFEAWDPVMTADEATELPPVIALPHENLIDLYVEKAVSPGVDCPSATTDSGNEFKEQSNAGSRRSSALSCENLRTEILDRIGEQHYEDVLFKPKQSRKTSKTKQKKIFVSETESGSDTMSISSVRSTSDEDPWSSERLDISSDFSIAVRPSEGLNNVQLNTKSSSEETLIRLGDSISSDIATLPGDTGSECDGTIINSALGETVIPQMSGKDKRPGGFCLGDECLVPPEIQPDLRSPASIERDVAHKERILAKVLHMDSFCDGDSKSEVIFNGKHICDVNKTETQEVIAENTKLKYVTSHSCIFSEEFHDAKDGDEETDDWGNQSESRNDECVSQHSDNIADSQDEKLASFSSILSYGPPSGSSAPPSNHTSLEIFSTSDPKTELSCDHRMYKTVERADQWVQYKVPGTIVNLSSCKYYVCCVDSKDTVYYSSLNGLSLEWQNVDYKAKQVAISPNGTLVWKLYKHRAYYLENPSVKGPFGGKWKEVAGNVQWISVSDSITWFVSDGYISVRKQLSSEQPPSPTRSVECNQPVTRICSFQNSVIALTSTGEVLFRSGVSDVVPEGKKWDKINIPCPPVTDIALGCHSTAWIVDQKNAIYFSCNFMAPDSQWWQVLISGYIFQRTTSLQHICNKLKLTENLCIRQQASVMIAAGEDTVWVGDKTTTSIHMNKTQFTGHQWSKVPLEHRRASLKWQKVSAEGIFEDRGQLWLLSTAGDLFSSCSNLQTVHALLLPDDSPVVCVAAATDTAWILTEKGNIYIRQGITDKCPSGKTWKELSLAELEGIRLTHLSCGCDVVWACNDQGDVYMAVGPPHSIPSSFLSPAWKTVDKSQQMNGCHQSTARRKNFFTKVFVGPQTYMVWALDSKKKIYAREGISNDSELGTGWVVVSGIEAVDLSISGTAVWALSPQGGVYCRCGITNTNIIGDYWKKIPGSVTAVTASVSDGLWALDKNHRLLRHHQFTVKMGKSAPTSSVAVNCTSDGDWEVVTCGTLL